MSKYIGRIRKLDQNGRISIPKELRDYFDLKENTLIEVVADKEKRTVIIRKLGEDK